MGKLITVGFKLAVLGVEELNPLSNWHIVKPGSYTMPILGEKLTYAKSLCGKYVLSNGYAQDHVPGEKEQCPACWERL